MHTRRNQQTIARPAAVDGFGYWSGRDVRVEFRPASPDTGVVFVRGDLAGAPRIPATIQLRTAAQRRTNLTSGRATVEMVEHIMAALAGLHIDNCEVWVDQQEMPGLDGSSLPFVAALDSAGVVSQPALRAQRVIDAVIRLGTAQSWIEASPSPTRQTVLEYELDYGPTSPIGRQKRQFLLDPATFRRELADSRTFLLQAEAEALLSRGLGRRATTGDLLVFGPQGPLGNQLRHPDECVRHKLLDLTGDLAMAGCDLIGHFQAYRSGHQLNAEMVATILTRTSMGQLRNCA